jgi:hypothetical protein
MSKYCALIVSYYTEQSYYDVQALIGPRIRLDALCHDDQILPTLASLCGEVIPVVLQGEKLIPLTVGQHPRLVLFQNTNGGPDRTGEHPRMQSREELAFETMVLRPSLRLACLAEATLAPAKIDSRWR